MAELPEIQIVDRSDVADWRYQARVCFPGETITFELRRGGDLRPTDPAVIEAQLRSQMFFDNYRPLIDQVQERSRQPVTLCFYQ